jgi:hypothetical protein
VAMNWMMPFSGGGEGHGMAYNIGYWIEIGVSSQHSTSMHAHFRARSNRDARILSQALGI